MSAAEADLIGLHHCIFQNVRYPVSFGHKLVGFLQSGQLVSTNAVDAQI